MNPVIITCTCYSTIYYSISFVIKGDKKLGTWRKLSSIFSAVYDPINQSEYFLTHMFPLLEIITDSKSQQKINMQPFLEVQVQFTLTLTVDQQPISSLHKNWL